MCIYGFTTVLLRSRPRSLYIHSGVYEYSVLLLPYDSAGLALCIYIAVYMNIELYYCLTIEQASLFVYA